VFDPVPLGSLPVLLVVGVGVPMLVRETEDDIILVSLAEGLAPDCD
jgi:hypothetical protein